MLIAIWVLNKSWPGDVQGLVLDGVPYLLHGRKNM